eukprot:gene8243-8433_t
MNGFKERNVINSYFGDGLAVAIRDSLKSLFAEPRLPDNPFYYLASVKVMQDVLSNSMPDSFFPGPTPFSGKDSYSTQVLASVQGSSAVWRPQWLEFPELMVRCDVVVRGPRLDEALAQFAALLTGDLRELDAVPVYLVQGLRIVDAFGAAVTNSSAPAQGQQRRSAAAADTYTKVKGAAASGTAATGVASAPAAGIPGFWQLTNILEHPEEFKKVVSRAVLGGKNLEVSAVVLLDAPRDTQHLQERCLRFEMAVKRYCFHFWCTSDSSTEMIPPAGSGPHTAQAGSSGKSSTTYSSRKLQAEVTHYGSSPYEALYEGYFMDLAAAKQYLQLFHQEHDNPYAAQPLAANVDQLACLVDSHMLQGETLEGLRRMLLLVLLQDPLPRASGPLSPPALQTLEELLLVKTPNSQLHMLLSTVPNLLRMINSGAAVIQAVVREMQAVQFVAQQWPSRAESCRAQAAATETPGMADEGGIAQPATGGAASTSGAARATAAISTLEWLEQFNMDGAIDCMASLQRLLEAAALTLADALLDRCRDVTWALNRFGIHLLDSVMARAALVTDEGDVAPEWVLHVADVTEAQVRAGAVVERVATEGVMLQYAVDCKLDVLLSSVYDSLTQPPMPLNPYPRLLHFLRAHAARLDLWRDDLPAVCDQLLNQLVLLAPPGFMYAAMPPDVASGYGRGGTGRYRRRGRLGAAVAAGATASGDDSDAVVYGSYAAVTLALRMLSSSLGALLSERHWQQGSYSGGVVPALVGDAWLSGALGLWEDAAIPAAHEEGPAGAGRFGSTAAAKCPFEHPRFFTVELEEHHQVSGPHMTEAAALFAAGILDYVLDLHHRSPHIMHKVAVPQNHQQQEFSLQQLLTNQGKKALVAAVLSAVKAATTSHRATYPDDPVAVIELLAAVKEGLYVQVVKHMHFNYKNEGLPMDTTSSAAAAHTASSCQQPTFLMPSSGSDASGDDVAGTRHAAGSTGPAGDGAQEDEPRWGLGVYRRVFLTESAANSWYSWNRLRGDPAQPFHYQHMVQQVQQQVQTLTSSGGLLDAQKLLLTAAAAMQDLDMLVNVSKATQSAAQELRCLRAINASLLFLLAADLPQEQRSKVDSERVRRLFLLYCTRLKGAVQLFCHLKAGCPLNPRKTPGAALIQQHLLATRINAQWGDTSLVQVRGGGALGRGALWVVSGVEDEGSAGGSPRGGGLRHIMLASGHDIPLRLLPPGTLPAGVTLYGSYDYPAEDLADLQAVMHRGMLAAGFSRPAADLWTGSLVPHHQWLCVSMEHALVLVALRDIILKVAEAVHQAWAAEGCGIAADEYIVITALRVAGCVRAVQTCSSPLARWYASKDLQPGVAANCHPTQVIYPLPADIQRLLDQSQGAAAAIFAMTKAGGAATAAGPGGGGGGSRRGSGAGGSAGCGSRGRKGSPRSSRAALLLASCAADKHPVTWRSLDQYVWCEEDEGGSMYGCRMTLRNLLAISAERGCLLLRKVDCRRSSTMDSIREAAEAEQKLLELLQQKMWAGQFPPVRSVARKLLMSKCDLDDVSGDSGDEDEGRAGARGRKKMREV